jgi:hypothetical protein
MLLGTDGGIHVSRDRGHSWDYVNTVPLAQFYEVSVDNAKPYNVCGGLQDNGTWLGPSRTLYQQGIATRMMRGGGDGLLRDDPSDRDRLRREPTATCSACTSGRSSAAPSAPSRRRARNTASTGTPRS